MQVLKKEICLALEKHFTAEETMQIQGDAGRKPKIFDLHVVFSNACGSVQTSISRH